MKNKILISPSSFGEIDGKPLDLLKENGFTFTINKFGRKLTESEVVDLGSDCCGIIAGVEKLNAEVLRKLPDLVCISRVGVGIDNIDIEYAKKNNIRIINTPYGPTKAVSELAIGMSLSLLRNIHDLNNKLKRLKWEKHIGNLLSEQKIGIIGMGKIGKYTSRLFRNFGCEVMGYDINPDNNWGKNNSVSFVDLNELLIKSNVICFHLPLIEESYFIDTNEFNLMKKDVKLINLSRGGVVNEKSLYEFLSSNSEASAAIDVFEEEPYKGELINLENTLVTPHIGSYAKESKVRMEIDSVNNLLKCLKNE